MKIVEFKEFLKYPANTIFSYLRDQNADGLYLKEESLKGLNGEYTDFFYTDLLDLFDFDDPLDKHEFLVKENYNKSFKTVLNGYREGLFDNSQVYIVYEKADLLLIKNCIDKAVCDGDKL